MGSAAAPFLLLLVVGISDAWVYADARRHERAGEAVTATLGRFRVSSAEGWLVACVVLWVFFVPLYLTARRS